MEIIKHNLKFTHTPVKRKSTKMIVLHCSANREGQDTTVENIHKGHLKRGFSGCGYQLIIYRDGSVHEGRPLDCGGAHAKGYNSISVGVSYVGGMDADYKKAKDTRTTEQRESLFEVVQYLQEKYGLTDEAIKCHNQLSKKQCPSFSRQTFIKEYTEWRNKKLTTKTNE